MISTGFPIFAMNSPASERPGSLIWMIAAEFFHSCAAPRVPMRVNWLPDIWQNQRPPAEPEYEEDAWNGPGPCSAGDC